MRRVRPTVLAFVVAMLPVLAQAQSPVTIFVSQGATGGDGSADRPFGTIGAAVAAAPPSGATIQIAAGTYPESIFFTDRQNLTFVGAGIDATHVVGGGDAVFVNRSTNIVLRDLHVASPNGRGIVAQGASMTLDHVSTIGNHGINVYGVGYLGTSSTFLIQNSVLDESQTEAGLFLENDVTATIQGTSLDRNRVGAQLLGNSVVTIENSSLSQNPRGGVLAAAQARAIIRYSAIVQNSDNGLLFRDQTSAEVYGNHIEGNGTGGPFGANGFNGIEVSGGWNGAQMSIHDNAIWNNSAFGVFIGAGQIAVVERNTFFGNFVGVVVDSSFSTTDPVRAVLRGNSFMVNADSLYQEGVFLSGSQVTATLGGPDIQTRNTYRNYVGNPEAPFGEPAVHCAGGATSICQPGSNVYQNCASPVLGCACQLDPADLGFGFVDVPTNHPFFQWIDALVNARITAGCSTNPPQYCPDAGVTRSQMAVFLLRGIHGADYHPPPATGMFADVPTTLTFADWIEELAREGITSGCSVSPPQYCPGAGVTRGQMAVFLLRAKHGAGYDPPPATGMFTDVPLSHPFVEWIEQLAREGITGGCSVSPPQYCPEVGVTRGQMAVFLVRAFNLPL
jgi:copper-binding protein NosD